MKKEFYYISLLIVTILVSLTGYGQQLGDNALLNDNHISAPPVKKGFNPQVTVSLGTSIGSFYPGFNSFGTYIMPEITKLTAHISCVRSSCSIIKICKHCLNNVDARGSVSN